VVDVVLVVLVVDVDVDVDVVDVVEVVVTTEQPVQLAQSTSGIELQGILIQSIIQTQHGLALHGPEVPYCVQSYMLVPLHAGSPKNSKLTYSCFLHTLHSISVNK